MKKLRIIKIGGNVLDDPRELELFLGDFSGLDGLNILVHGGGKIASALGKKMGIEPRMHEGRRLTDRETLDLVVMVYAGLIGKQIAATLQNLGCNAISLCGADANLLPARRRPAGAIDYGFVGDLDQSLLSALPFESLLDAGFSLVLAPISHQHGQLLNTNADTIASSVAILLAGRYEVELYYCFEKEGVLDASGKVLPRLGKPAFTEMKSSGAISAGMIPKLDNAFAAREAGVTKICILHSRELPSVAAGKLSGTQIRNDE